MWRRVEFIKLLILPIKHSSNEKSKSKYLIYFSCNNPILFKFNLIILVKNLKLQWCSARNYSAANRITNKGFIMVIFLCYKRIKIFHTNRTIQKIQGWYIFFMLEKPVFEKFKIVFRGFKEDLIAQKKIFLKSGEMLRFSAY